MREAAGKYLLFRVGRTDCAIAASSVREVACGLPLTPVPAAPQGVAGIVNLRGHVLATIDMGFLLQETSSQAGAVNIIAACGDAFYSLLADSCGDVVLLAPEALEPLPASAATWGRLARKICRYKRRIMPVIDVAYLMSRSDAALTGAEKHEEMPDRG